jgi:hypothetical protein
VHSLVAEIQVYSPLLVLQYEQSQSEIPDKCHGKRASKGFKHVGLEMEMLTTK